MKIGHHDRAQLTRIVWVEKDILNMLTTQTKKNLLVEEELYKEVLEETDIEFFEDPLLWYIFSDMYKY